MTRRSPIIGFIVAILTTGCDPVFSLRVRQALQPRPPQECLETALASSPEVVQATPLRHTKGGLAFQVVFRDSLSPTGRWYGEMTQRAPPGSASVVSVTYTWIRVHAPSGIEKEHIA